MGVIVEESSETWAQLREREITILQCYRLDPPPQKYNDRMMIGGKVFRILENICEPKAPIVAIFTGTSGERHKKEQEFMAAFNEEIKRYGGLVEWHSTVHYVDSSLDYARWRARVLLGVNKVI